jgi:shikimate kinase
MLEMEALERVAALHKPLVLSCGGGIVLHEKNRQLLLDTFVVVWLDVPIDEIYHRLEVSPGGRPLLDEVDRVDTIRRLFTMRYELYERTHHIRYRWQEGDTSPDISADQIIKAVNSLKENPDLGL